MSSSPREKEKLRKKLQKLFQKEGILNKPAAGKSNDKQPKRVEEDIVQNAVAKGQQEKENKAKNLKGAKKSPKKIHINSKKASKQTDLDMLPDKQKYGGYAMKQDKQTDVNLQKKSSAIKTNTERHSLKQQSVPALPKKSRQQTDKVEKGSKTSKSKHRQKCGKSAHKQVRREESNLVANNAEILNKQKTKIIKRTASAGTLKNETVISPKKQKFTEKPCGTNRTVTLSNQKRESKASADIFPSYLQSDHEYDVNGMTGYVRGGDFYSDSEEEYHEPYYSEDSSPSSTSDSEDNTIQTFKGNSRETDLEKYDKNVSTNSEEKYSDSDDEDPSFDYYEDNSYEEQEENCPYFDESDYEEDEDSSTDSTSDDDSFSNCYDYMNDYNDSDSDRDYELPKHIPEDLIIHSGTSIKRDLVPEDNIWFDSEDEDSKIIELENQSAVKVIYQPKANEKEELLKLQYDEKSLNVLKHYKKESPSNDSQDCPKLVPIVDEDGFQLCNTSEQMYDGEEQAPEENEDSMEEYENDSLKEASLGSEYTEVNSDEMDSLQSEDINEKYLNRNHDDIDSDDGIDENMWKNTVEVIDATGYKYENEIDHSNKQSNINLNDDTSQTNSLKLYDNVDLKTKCSILSTTIIDNKIFDTKTNEPPKVSPNYTELALGQCLVATQENDNEKENITTEIEPLPKALMSTGQNLVKYKITSRTKFFNAFNSNTVLVLLKYPFYLYGTARLTLLAGAVEIYGHPLVLNTEVEIFSPRGCSLIDISPLNSNNNISKKNLNDLLKVYKQHFALADLRKIGELYNCETDAVVLLKRNEERKKIVQQFKKFMNENIFPNINNINMDRSLYNSEYLLRCMINTSAEEQKCLRLPQQWQQLNITSKSRVMLAGGKSVGKSTLLRYLINRHLPQKILLIDLDIGQPEVFIPQTISCSIVKQPLLGPGFFLNIQPELAYAVGHTNILLCAHKYIAAVRSLIAYCNSQEEYKDMPWLINTMGYNKGFGLELISVIAQELPLTDLIQLQSTKDINNFDSTLHPHILSGMPYIFFPEENGDEENVKEKLNYHLHVWQSAVEQKSRYQKDWEMSAKDLRFSMFLARLSEALRGHAEWLTDVKPFSASLNEIKIVNLTDNTPSATVEQLAKVIEANLVYLCHYEEDIKPLKCLGIGIVRAIDFNVQQLYIIPALPDTQLKDFNCLAIGEFPLPTSLFTNQGPRVKNIAPYVYTTIAANASKAIKQIHHRPRAFLTGQHKSLE